jgi:pimeloyl-ACP methyl ester carboxylesterase
VLNDVGPALQWAGLERIRGYVGQVGPFGSLGEGVYYLRGRLAGFGPHSDAQWTALNAPMFRPALREAPQASAVVLHYDPAIGRPFEALTPEASAQSAEAMRAVYRQLACQTLLLRGAQSELLSREVALEMTITGPKARLVEFAGVGHAPTLVAADQVQVVREFLLGD